mgnify:CR=1 FL=1
MTDPRPAYEQRQAGLALGRPCEAQKHRPDAGVGPQVEAGAGAQAAQAHLPPVGPAVAGLQRGAHEEAARKHRRVGQALVPAQPGQGHGVARHLAQAIARELLEAAQFVLAGQRAVACV